MNNLRFLFAMAAGKLAAFALKAMGRNASHMPGVIALRLCPDLLAHFQKPEHLICVTGTNGKTTTSNFITSVLAAAGIRVTNNSFGSNIRDGIAAVLLQNASLTGKPKNDWAVLEVDERSSLLIYPYIKPDYIVVNNIMRDSLKRNAHTEFISYVISSAVPKETRLILNADDIICSQLAPQCENRVYFGMDAERPERAEGMAARDIVYCPQCGARLEPEYLRWNHIGRWRCTGCAFASPARDYTVTRIDRENGEFFVEHAGETRSYKLVNDNVVNVFNFCGAIALLTELGIGYEQITAAFRGAELVKTRFEKRTAGDLDITMILAKGQNPVAVSRVFSYVAKCPGEEKCVLLIIDDKEDNIRNSESSCWLYDLDYTPLGDPSIAKLIFAGKRRFDHILRAAMTGIDLSGIETVEAVRDCYRLVDTDRYKNIFVLYDNYLMDEARREVRMLEEKGAGNA